MEKLYTPEEAAKFLAVNPNTVRTWLREGQIKGVKLGGRIWRISEEDLKDFINQNRGSVAARLNISMEAE
jgi:excisionase family DNA binding protein